MSRAVFDQLAWSVWTLLCGNQAAITGQALATAYMHWTHDATITFVVVLWMLCKV